ncbi:peptide deformylase [Alkalispirochaeta sphaeroplastigenens]|uniref:peptide deformylase n=1 Tax=Alkalispirochaeta sphaeroplastigenens TaxID=1187066 RepID=UPI000CDB60F4|nr:peptide deformylase [Alkalispirochaeta sphaeroplastigenens]
MISLVYHPDERLVTPAEPLAEINAGTEKLAAAMIQTMVQANGIGLAGPQVGKMERLFVVGLPDEPPLVFVNPRITARSPDEEKYEEGCLSIPGVYASVVRPRAIALEAWDTRGNPFSMEAEGLLARVILHEYDHLEGVLFLDHLTQRRRERLLRSYRKPESPETWE